MQNLPANSNIGYNMTFTTSRDTMVATLPIGYAVGYPRSLSNKAIVHIDEYQASVVGRISMQTFFMISLNKDKIVQ